MQAEEIQECLWMPVEEFLSVETVSPFNKWVVRAGLENPGMVPTWVDGFANDGEREFFVWVDHQTSKPPWGQGTRTPG